ncbi:MAG: c-type cytochrome biogenesis protein CcmI [Rhodobacteraceae bacterium]|nr:c-type cytochrome biogenesis protein CcmI [Paracoccaceae bacterium]
MLFWIAASAVSVVVVLAIQAAFLLHPRGGVLPAPAYDLQIYRDQMNELERDVARGVVTRAEAARTRAEIGRRVLGADRALHAAGATGGTGVTGAGRPSGAGHGLVGVALLVMVGGSFGVYWLVGAPGYGDVPLAHRISMVEAARAQRPNQDTAESEITTRPRTTVNEDHAALVARLRTAMERRPDDIQGLTLLARNEAALGNFRAGHLAQGRLIALLGGEATARHHADHAEMMVLAAGGYVSPQAEAALEQALALAPGNGTARYYVGLMYAQQGRPDLAYPIWRDLLAESAPGAPWVGPIRLQIEGVAVQVGAPVTLAELPQPRDGAPGPTAEQIQAAQTMPPEARAAMIDTMVRGLAERLATEGGPPQDWARLIRALAVLGHTERARAIYAQARSTFADSPEALRVLQDAAAALAAPAE